METLKLNLGCWHAWRDGCINMDRRLDPAWRDREGMFVKDRMTKLDELFHCESVSEIWANDVLSGRSYPEAARMLASWRKILVPDGKLHVLTDARLGIDFLVGILREVGYNVLMIERNGRWTTVEAERNGVR